MKHTDEAAGENRRSAWVIAQEWYDSDGVHRAIQSAGSDEFGSWPKIPSDVASREFAEWLTHQYRLAMAKGIQLGRDR